MEKKKEGFDASKLIYSTYIRRMDLRKLLDVSEAVMNQIWPELFREIQRELDERGYTLPSGRKYLPTELVWQKLENRGIKLESVLRRFKLKK